MWVNLEVMSGQRFWITIAESQSKPIPALFSYPTTWQTCWLVSQFPGPATYGSIKVTL